MAKDSIDHESCGSDTDHQRRTREENRQVSAFCDSIQPMRGGDRSGDGCIHVCSLVEDDPRKKISMPKRIGFCIASFFAIGQNLMFMAHGLYQSLTVFSTTGMTLLAIGSFLIIYAINTVITINGIRMFKDKPWGMIAPLMIACAGANLISLF